MTSDAPAAREIDEGLARPDGILPWLCADRRHPARPLYAYHLTVVRGLNPSTRTINKVIEMR